MKRGPLGGIEGRTEGRYDVNTALQRLDFIRQAVAFRLHDTDLELIKPWAGRGRGRFGIGAEPELCRCGWEAARCPRQFAFPPAQHEILLGRLPLASRGMGICIGEFRGENPA